MLQWCLRQVNWHDPHLISDLLGGFPLVGFIPSDLSARQKSVRKPKLDVDELRRRVSSLRAKAIERHARHVTPETDKDILR